MHVDAFGLALAVNYYQRQKEFVQGYKRREWDDPDYLILKPVYGEYQQKHSTVYQLVNERNLTEEFELLYEWMRDLSKEVRLFRYTLTFGEPRNYVWDFDLVMRIVEAYDKADARRLKEPTTS